MKPLRVAVQSGKGGTGKTTVAVALALSLPRAHLVDADVEEPDAALFLGGLSIRHREEVRSVVPVPDDGRCDACADRRRAVCAEVCEYGALAVVAGRVRVFPERCNGCGACLDLCPRGALREGAKVVGTIEEGRAGDLLFTRGVLRVGEPRAGELIRAVLRRADPDRVVVVDGPPGSGGAAAAALDGAGAALLVVEPTPFGRRDLERIAALARRLRVPAGVIVNRADGRDSGIAKTAAREGLEVLLRIPYSRRVAEAGLHGVPLATVLPETGRRLAAIVAGLATGAGRRAAR